MQWTTQKMASQAEKTVIVTGANSGIGFETAKALARKGAHVVLACRDQGKGEQACAQISSLGVAGSVECMPLNLADLASVSDFAAAFLARHPRLDMLINNAGIMVPPKATTVDGFEVQMGTNHMGHFALTGLLLGRLLEAPSPRIVVVSSSAHTLGNIPEGDIRPNASRRCACHCHCLSNWKAYCDSKLANMYFMHELHKRYGNGKTTLTAAAAHPGWTATNLQQHTSARRFNCLFAMEPWQGALPSLFAATEPSLRGGEYIGPDGCLGLTGFPKSVEPSKRSKDATISARLWRMSEELTGVRYASH